MLKCPEMPESVAEVYDSYPVEIRDRLCDVRELIFEVAAETRGVGALTETLKWGQPSYLTEETGSGSTIRLGWNPKTPEKFHVYFICTTNLVETFREMHADVLTFEGNRAIVCDAHAPLDEAALASCLRLALTYKLKRA